VLPGVPAVPGIPLDPGGPMPFEPPMEQPFSTMPDAGAALPKLIPPSVTATDVPREQPLPAIAAPEVAVPGEAVAQETPQADVPPTDLVAPDQPAAEATDVAAVASAEPEVLEAADTELPDRLELNPPEARALQANWMAALHPGFRGERDRIASSYPSVGSAVAVEPDEVPAKEVPAKETPAKQGANASSHHEQPVSYEQHVGEEAIALPVALGGYCPIELLINERWVESDPRWTASHQGRRYLFAGEAQRRQFLDDPDRFVPVHSGNDPVLVVDDKRRVPGRMDHCVTYEGRLYMFSTTATLAVFQEKPERYAAKGE